MNTLGYHMMTYLKYNFKRLIIFDATALYIQFLMQLVFKFEQLIFKYNIYFMYFRKYPNSQIGA